ncbi:MAG: MMPL family transporter [Candidatus Thiodiazotropha sp. (ex Ctena orbiculata)]|nr:MMPL family transporter [Candidatus Thiodiazotropha taylori]MBT3001809.1 MMPL family transporter [Candidatus Thiodiazotropha taylori]MBV2108367.1 MMPL family transporter [Candidatus Thiodiazotropha taylori]MBV2109419.1 MMPL family transporter [Candidatus Thiodiazotropha taylori]
MKRLITAAAHRPWLVFTVTLFITLSAALQLSALRIEISAEGMMVNHPEVVADYKESLQTFGSDAVTVIYLEDEGLLQPANLTAIRQALRRIEAIPRVSHTTSLFSVRYLRTENGYVYTRPYLESIPQSQNQVEEITNAALLNPLIERNLLSRDGTVMAINLYLDMQDYHRGFDEAVSRALDEAIAPLRSRLRQVFHLGDPSIRTGISKQIRNDLKIILPLSLSVLALTLWLIFKRSCVALIPLLTAGVSVVWTLGVMAVMEIPVNVMTSIIPALLIIIGCTEDIHLIAEYRSGIRAGLTRLDAIRSMANYMGTAILLTFFTTSLGFLSIALNRIDLLQQFGLVTAVGLAFNFLLTSTLVPACLQGLSRDDCGGHLSAGTSFSSAAEKLFSWQSRHPRRLFLALALVMLVSAYWSTRIEVNNSVMDYFPASSSLPEQAAQIRDKLSGIQTLTILINGIDGAFLKSANIQQLHKLQQQLEAQAEFEKSFSFADFISVVHSGIDGERADKAPLPESDELIEGYMSLLGHASAKAFVSPDFNQARIIVRHGIESSKQLNQAVEEIVEFAEQSLDSSLKMKITGSSYLNSQAADYMADSQSRSLIMILGVIFVLITLLLGNAKIGLVAVLSNLFPIVALFGIMGFFNIALDTGTVMVAAIALGVCVDHSMHFMVRYQRLMDSGSSQLDSLLQTIRHESKPIITTSLALGLGFTTLAFSAFPPVSQFGILSALVMLLALIGTFVLIPLTLKFCDTHLDTARTETNIQPIL